MGKNERTNNVRNKTNKTKQYKRKETTRQSCVDPRNKKTISIGRTRNKSIVDFVVMQAAADTLSTNLLHDDRTEINNNNRGNSIHNRRSQRRRRQRERKTKTNS